MRFDEEWQNGFKGFAVAWAVIITVSGAVFALILLIITAQYVSRNNTIKDIELWQSKGCSIVDTKDNIPIYKCEGTDDD